MPWYHNMMIWYDPPPTIYNICSQKTVFFYQYEPKAVLLCSVYLDHFKSVDLICNVDRIARYTINSCSHTYVGVVTNYKLLYTIETMILFFLQIYIII